MSCQVKMAYGTSIIWFFLSQFSQSTLYGRNASNACTFIALLLAKFYFLYKTALSLSKYMSGSAQVNACAYVLPRCSASLVSYGGRELGTT